MLKYLIGVGSMLALALLVGVVVAADLQSGPQVGQKVPGPFHPLNVTGEHAGEKFCLFCQAGASPIAMIFARENSPELTSLIKKIDGCTIKNSDSGMRSFVVYLSDAEKLNEELKGLASKEKLQQIVLSIDNPPGPKGYQVAKEADVTVVLYSSRVVRANFAFKKGELKENNITQIVNGVAKILPQK